MMANKWMPIALGDRELPGWLTGVVLLLARCWVALVFFNAGWLKLTSWDSTLYLFEFEYQVPLLPWLWRPGWARRRSWCCRCFCWPAC